jgi:hypothetical protein
VDARGPRRARHPARAHRHPQRRETAPADRIRIAREFNGLSSEPPAPGTCARPSDTTTTPKYDVVIANSVAYEGIDLQVRTCTIHHLDLPWTPADLEQRNGRGVRQGNTLGTVNIFYYFADGSTDGYRFSLIDGKAGLARRADQVAGPRHQQPRRAAAAHAPRTSC